MEMILEGSRIARHEMDMATAPPKAGEYLTYCLGQEEYAIDIQKVQEIRSYEPPTRIPNARAFVKGVVNLRGVIVPIVDLRLKLSCAAAEYTAFTVVIVLSVRDRVVGVVVDSVSDVMNLGTDSIKPPPELPGEPGQGFITGIASVDKRLLMLVDIESLLGDEVFGVPQSTH